MARRHRRKAPRWLVTITSPRWGACDELIGTRTHAVRAYRSARRARALAAQIADRYEPGEVRVDVVLAHLGPEGRWRLAAPPRRSPHRVAVRRLRAAYRHDVFF
jgi:hypothetical protein